ncbi:hypothetical protein MSAN_00844800 [Mycena sanguinolenta]|uniref:Uncharacterized protein n=1 Tax=Mycena sanguinolenta TaxID=230812 RepID=A0A8H6Z0U9_9AGAR|nr:hypothetical protein MSAN_00844800 [Mycena sanguinolenta]
MDLRSTSSHRSVIESSVYTTTSSSTQWGPGAFAGKAIRAMGKAVLRSAEYIVISRRLSAIRAGLSRRDDNQQSWERVFDDLLELSRPALYPEAFRAEAMHILVARIASEDTYHLQCSFSKWEIDHEELVAFFSEIIGVVLFSKRGFADERLLNAYMMALPDTRHPWLPCVRFMTAIARLSDSLLHGVVAARFLEMILWVSGAQTLQKDPDHLLADACSEAFMILSQPPADQLYVFWVEEIGGPGLRSRNSVNSLREVLTCITVEHLWLVIEARLLEVHSDAMLKSVLRHWQLFRVHRRVSLQNSFFPISAFGNFQPRIAISHSQVSLSARFTRNFLRCVGIGGDVLDKTFNYLSGLSYEKKVVVLAGMIEHLIVQSYIDPSAVDSSIMLFTPEAPDIASNIVQFLIAVSNSIAESPLLDAALLNITTPILASVPPPYIETFAQY